MNIVLISSGLNSVATQLLSLPARAVGIIELHSNNPESGLRSFIKSSRALIKGKKYSNLREYAAHHKLHYACMLNRDAEGLKKTLEAWNTNLVITYYCPMVPMEAVSGLSHGAINLHPSLLPDYRGGNPLFWQVHDQVEYTGATVHHLEQSFDTGPIIGQLSVRRPPNTSKEELTELTVSELGPRLLKDAVQRIENGLGTVIVQPQKSNTRYAGNFHLTEFSSLVDLQQLSLRALYDICCYYREWPAEIAQYNGWRKFFKWVPAKMTESDCPANTIENGTLCTERLQIKLLHQQGYITLLPVFSIKHSIKAFCKTWLNIQVEFRH